MTEKNAIFNISFKKKSRKCIFVVIILTQNSGVEGIFYLFKKTDQLIFLRKDCYY